jgi:metal-dependent amidase/aminoacylase/carboxypeptidase family protein
MRLFINFWNLFLILINFSVYSQIGEDEFLKIENKIIKWRHHIHENPELSNREYETAEYISKHLQKLGIEVKNRVAHTGVVGLLKGTMPGKVLAIRADMDALPVTERNELKYKSIKTSVFNNQKTGAEDFSYFQSEIPGFFYFLGGTPLSVKESDAPSHHTPDFIVDDGAMLLGVRAMTQMALDYLSY